MTAAGECIARIRELCRDGVILPVDQPSNRGRSCIRPTISGQDLSGFKDAYDKAKLRLVMGNRFCPAERAAVGGLVELVSGSIKDVSSALSRQSVLSAVGVGIPLSHYQEMSIVSRPKW